MTGAPDRPAARLSRVTRRFGKAAVPALDQVSLQIRAGRMTGLVGPDGAGKTTMIRLLAGLLDPDEGEVEVLGSPAVSADRSRIGYMPQRFGLYEDLTVIENLRLYARLRGLAAESRQQRFDRLLDFTDLRRFQSRLAGNLSGGMKQKLGLACALVETPDLLLLDEPGVGVDPLSRRELWGMVQQLLTDGIAVLWSTAYLDEAAQCDEVFLLNEGRLIYGGPPQDLTREAEGATYRLAAQGLARRQLLSRLADREEVRDATIQGAALRLLMAPGAPPPSGALAVPPRFEDAFVARMGGGPGGRSALAESYPEVPDTGAPAIEAEGLTRRFGSFTAASDIRFTVPRGEIFGLLGPNGAGKSTTFKMLCGLLHPSAGRGRVAGHDLGHARAAARQSLGYMAQKFSLYGDLSVRQNLSFFAGVYGLAGAGRRRAMERMTEIFHLGPYLKQNAGGLPLGVRQRLSLACAVMHEPPVLFLDEPTSGVDPIVRREFWTHINGLVQRGVTVLVTTHFMEEAEYCDRILVIYRAEQIALGSPDQLKAEAAGTGGLSDPTLEDAFVALIEARETAVGRAGAAA
ncbi:ATP-binding cassette domain-containing protein [Pseudodonghicola flavimaris]|uniref:ATP-binding cassette domain-containing protein n=1 Tax=Pseudodonghicola flavimaris TaxID=3050036 RepID=A0ABT7F2R2_9RHOB|nr:ATP-binding cassette domain-containing protein [Pseudodonghicola flavimaris]MDK3018896.1 ATP-binding cassette domain-containing protein [Pseudodonghicola flavimaris]